VVGFTQCAIGVEKTGRFRQARRRPRGADRAHGWRILPGTAWHPWAADGSPL